MRQFAIVWLKASEKSRCTCKIKAWINKHARASILRERLGGALSLIFIYLWQKQIPGLYCTFDSSESEIPVAVPPPSPAWRCLDNISAETHRGDSADGGAAKMQWVSYSHLLRSALLYTSGLISLAEHTSAPTPRQVWLALDRFLLLRSFSSPN